MKRTDVNARKSKRNKVFHDEPKENGKSTLKRKSVEDIRQAKQQQKRGSFVQVTTTVLDSQARGPIKISKIGTELLRSTVIYRIG